MFTCTDILLLSYTVRDNIEAFNLLWDELFCSLLMEALLLCYVTVAFKSRSCFNLWPQKFYFCAGNT
jgi:hypothetical protein